jgi:hypothetical protein
MTLLTSQLAPMHFLTAQNQSGASNLDHERSKGGSTDKAETSLDGAGSTGGLGESGRASTVAGTGGRGTQRVGDSHRAGGQDGGVVSRGTGAGDVGAGAANGLDGGRVRSNRARLDDRRRSNGVASRAGCDRVSSRSGRDSRGAGRGRAGDGSNRAGGGNDGAALLGDTELSGVLVLAGNVVDQLESVVGGVSLESRGRGPDEGTGVGDALNESLDGDNVGGRSTEEEERDRVGGSWLPGDGEGLASRDNLDQRTSDGVASGFANRGVELRSGNAGEESNDGGLGEHVVGIM